MMTREEYKLQALRLFHESFVYHCTFPELLFTVARELFSLNETDSDLAVETKRRIKQLREEGFTDD